MLFISEACFNTLQFGKIIFAHLITMQVYYMTFRRYQQSISCWKFYLEIFQLRLFILFCKKVVMQEKLNWFNFLKYRISQFGCNRTSSRLWSSLDFNYLPSINSQNNSIGKRLKLRYGKFFNFECWKLHPYKGYIIYGKFNAVDKGLKNKFQCYKITL